ncbi:MAG: ureidoglycolate lyase [Geminicoccaceae bacterium]
MSPLRPLPLTPDAFRPYGRVAAAGHGDVRSVNAGTALRFDADAGFDRAAGATRPVLAVYRSQPQALPLAVPLLERHPHSSQTFVAMDGARWLVVVAVDPAVPAAFLVAPGQAVTYGRGVWHSPLLVLGRAADFAMLMWETGAGDDTELLPLDRPLTVLEP